MSAYVTLQDENERKRKKRIKGRQNVWSPSHKNVNPTPQPLEGRFVKDSPVDRPELIPFPH